MNLKYMNLIYYINGFIRYHFTLNELNYRCMNLSPLKPRI